MYKPFVGDLNQSIWTSVMDHQTPDYNRDGTVAALGETLTFSEHSSVLRGGSFGIANSGSQFFDYTKPPTAIPTNYILGYQSPTLANFEYPVDDTYVFYDGHDGHDFGVGGNALAVAPGIVAFAGDSGTPFGRIVDIYHPQGYMSRYAHLASINNLHKGDQISQAGMPIGVIGGSAHRGDKLIDNPNPGSWPVHLHLSVFRWNSAKSEWEITDPFGWDPWKPSNQQWEDPLVKCNGEISYDLWVNRFPTAVGGDSTVSTTMPSGQRYLGGWFYDSSLPDSSTCANVIPSLVGPTDGSNFSANQSVTFSWSAVSGCSRYRFEAWDDSSPGVGKWIDVDGTSYTYTPSATGSWRWQVRVRKSDGSVGDAPHTSGFTVSPGGTGSSCTAGVPSLSNPRDGTSFTAGQPVTFSWSSVAGCSRYRFEAWDDSSPGVGNWVDIDGTSYTFAPGATGSWRWQVRVRKADGSAGDAPHTNGFNVSGSSAGHDWAATYYNDTSLGGQCNAGGFDGTYVFQDWRESAPISGCNPDNWSARFTRRLHFDGGSYTFGLGSDDWARLWVGGDLVVDNWQGHGQHYEGRQLGAGDYDIKVEYADTLGSAKLSAWWWGPGYDLPQESAQDGCWIAHYWANPELWWDAATHVRECSTFFDHDWADQPPVKNLPTDQFSGAAVKTATFAAGWTRFHIRTDDGGRLYVDGNLYLDDWVAHSATERTADVQLAAGQHAVRYEFVDFGSDASAHVWWDPALPAPPSTGDPCGGGTVAYWGMTEASGTTIHDKCHGYDGSWTQGVNWASDTEGPYLQFASGDGQRILINQPALSDATSTTVELRVMRGTGGTQRIISQMGPNQLRYTLDWSGSRLDVWGQTGDAWLWFCGDSKTDCLPPGQWVTIQFQIDGSLVHLFYDGQLKWTGSLPSPQALRQTSAPTEIGNGEGRNGFDGRIQYIRISRGVRSDFLSGGRTLQLNVAKTGTGDGTVVSVPAGISCGAVCTQAFATGTPVILNATAAVGSRFAGWSGDCTGTGECAVTLSAARSFSATFDKVQYGLTLTKSGTGSGSITSSPAGIDCGSICSYAFAGGTTVNIAAAADGGSTFVGWGGVCSGVGSCVVTLDTAKSVTATFNRPTALTASPVSVQPGATVAASWSQLATTGNDWISVHPAGAPDSQYLDWKPISGSSGSIDFNAPALAGSYEFRLFANGPRVATSNSFQVNPGAPVLSSPLNGSTLPQGAHVTLSWAAVSGIDGYVFELTEVGTGQVAMLNSSTTSYDVGVLSPDNYSWRVKVHNVSGDGPWSNLWTFSVAAPSVAVKSLSVSPASVTGGLSATGTVTLAAVAPAGGAVIPLASSNPAASIPTSVTITAGATKATFQIATSAVPTDAPAVLTAGSGTASKTATLTVKAPVLSSLSLAPSTVLGGKPSTGTVKLSGAAPTGGALVTLTSDSSAAAGVAGTVTVLEGSTSAIFTITTTPVPSTVAVNIGVAAGGVSKAAVLTVTAPALMALSFAPTTVTGGCLGATGTVTLSGAVSADTPVALAVSVGGAAIASLPANVVVPAGGSAAQFSVATQPIATATNVTITAAFNGASKAASFKVQPLVPTALTVSPTSVKGGATSTGTITVGCAPLSDLPVTLSVTGGGTALANMPINVTIPAGSTSKTFALATRPVVARTSVLLEATANGTTKKATLTVNP